MSFNNSGRLRHAMELQEFTSTGDYADGDAWDTIASVWCEIVPVSGRQANEGDMKLPVITHKIRTRDNDQAITVGHRLKEGSRLFAIEYVIDPSERGDFVEIGCTEVIA